MAIHWLARVPWAEIIANAPRIVEGAKKLSVYFKKPASGRPAARTAAVPSRYETPEQEIAALKARVAELEAAEVSSAQVIQSLADNSEKMAEALASLHRQAVLNFRLAIVCLIGVIALALAFLK